MASPSTDREYEAGFADRSARYLTAVQQSGVQRTDAADGIFQLVPSDIFRMVPALALGIGALDASPLPAALDRIARRRDCADFVLAGLQRILALFSHSPLLAERGLRASMEDAVLGFCYWYDQPGISGMCFHTENHQILFHACEVLAGERFPDHTFRNSRRSGAWHADHGTAHALRWIDQRARFGFAEWLSCYFEEDLLALLNIFDFAESDLLRKRAGMIVDMILFEIALNAHGGVLGTTHGRTYAEYVRGGREDPISAISWLVFGTGVFTDRPNLALAALSTSTYRCPTVIREIAAAMPAEQISRQACGLPVCEAARWGLDPQSRESQMFFWACQTARHPAVRAASVDMASAAEDPWLADFVASADARLETTRSVVKSGGAKFDGDAIDTALGPANLMNYRTQNYSLSCVQDFRAGRPGYQQHVWQATLDPDAVVFTSHPGADGQSSAHGDRPNFWAGNRYLPRAAQWRNVLVCIHHALPDDPHPYSHAYFPRAHFDEIVVIGNWIFGQKAHALIALYSQHSPVWTESGTEPPVELRAQSHDNVWVCEMGEIGRWRSLSDFADAIAESDLLCDGLSVRYVSPTIGEMNFGYVGPLTVAGADVALANYPRYDNPYCRAEIGDRHYTVRYGSRNLVWDFERA